MTKNQTRLIKSLHEKKYRNELGLFLVEGEKNVAELLQSDFTINTLYVTDYFYNKYKDDISKFTHEISGTDELEKAGTLESNDSAIAIVEKKNTLFKTNGNEIILALDTIQDPGNLGTIIRIADWYGIKNIICSEDTADFYNPKVISATKGSFLRINISYGNLEEVLPKLGLEIFGAFLDGEDVHKAVFPASGVLLMGNESKGISESLEKLVTKKITIPQYGDAESLNVGIATAIIVDVFKNSQSQ